MSDTDRYGASFATEVETVDGTWTFGDREFDLQCEEVTMREFEVIQEYFGVVMEASENPEDVDDTLGGDLPALPWEEEDTDTDFIVSVMEEKLIRPAIDPRDVPPRKLARILEGMVTAWQDGEVNDVREEMPLEGNP